jgi:predicted transcriptional regulator of viral defense system
MEIRRSQYSGAGLGKASRPQLAAVLRASSGTITPANAAKTLSIPRVQAAKLLARWTAQGWLQRVRRGLYVAVPLESERIDAAPEDPWVIAAAAFTPCFVSGWSAAEHWGLTEQIFRTISISTARRMRNREPQLGGTSFRLRTVSPSEFFGLSTVWRGRAKVQVTDPSRTILDVLADPSMGGGLRSAVDMFRTYLRSKDLRNVAQIVAYASTLRTGAVFKRLGFLLEQLAPDEQSAIAACSASMTQGYTKLDPAQRAAQLVTRWRLWLPEHWTP